MATITLRLPIVMAISDKAKASGVASTFGMRFAEAPILEKMKADTALGQPGDFGLYGDKGNNDSDPEMFTFIALRNNLPKESISAMKNYRATNAWSRPDALVHTRAVKEYYEIKPESADSIGGGQRKFPNIDSFVKHFGLPYQRGQSYLPTGTDEAPLFEDNNSFKQEKQSLEKMFGVGNVRFFIQWERPEAGLIVYRAKVSFETDRPKPKEIPPWMNDFARCVTILGIEAAIPGTFNGLSATNALSQGLVRLREPLNELKRNIQERMGLHKRLLEGATASTLQKATTIAGLLTPGLQIPTIINLSTNPAVRPVVGAAVQTLNPAKHGLEIWKQAQDALTATESALRAGNFTKALAQFIIGQASFVRASEQLEAFQKGTALAARRAEITIKVTAALAALAAVAAYSAPVLATGATTTAAAGAAAPAQVQVRVAQFLRVSMEALATAESAPLAEVAVEAIQEESPRMAARLVLGGN